jgi:hypothetical protein
MLTETEAAMVDISDYQSQDLRINEKRQGLITGGIGFISRTATIAFNWLKDRKEAAEH